MKRLVSVASTILVASIILFLGLFGPAFQANIHQAYLRYTMKDVVMITNSTGAGGTGFVTKSKSGRKIIITNGHVCGLQENGYVLVNYRGGQYKQKLIRVYPLHDLCAVEAPENASSGYSIASSVLLGESVYTLGHPYLEPNSLTKGEYSGPVIVRLGAGYNVTKGECSGPTYSIEQAEGMMLFFGIHNICIRTLLSNSSTIVVLPGNSGSPDVNIFGNVVGVTFAGNEAGTRTYHVPLSDLKQFLSEL